MKAATYMSTGFYKNILESAGEEKEYEKVAGFFISMQNTPRTKSNNLPKQQIILDMFS